MKIILVIFLYITSSQCGVLKDGLEKTNAAECNISVTNLVGVIDSYEKDNITLTTDVLIDITKYEEIPAVNLGTDTSKLPPGLHKWEMKFNTSEQSAEEISRIIGIVETVAEKTGEVSRKTCTTQGAAVTCKLNISIAGADEPVSNTNTRKMKIKH